MSHAIYPICGVTPGSVVTASFTEGALDCEVVKVNKRSLLVRHPQSGKIVKRKAQQAYPSRP